MRATWIVPPCPGLIEPAMAPEFFIDGVGAIEKIGDCIRIYFCAEQMPIEAGGAPAHKIVTVKIVRPLASVPIAMASFMRCLIPAASIPQPERGPFPHLVT
jgi:hypothetical protein